jgi:hypothetical protein
MDSRVANAGSISSVGEPIERLRPGREVADGVLDVKGSHLSTSVFGLSDYDGPYGGRRPPTIPTLWGFWASGSERVDLAARTLHA